MIASQMNMKREERIQYVQEAVTEITQAIQDLELENVSVYGATKAYLFDLSQDDGQA